MLRNILLGVGLFAFLLSVLIFSGKLPIGNQAQKARGEVQLWGTFPEVQMNAVIQEFNPKAKDYAVRYTYVPEANFNQRLLEALANGTGPDMIMADYKTILSNESRIQPYPAASFPEKLFKDTYVDGAGVLFTQAGALALPVSIEPMVLFYNRTLFSKHGLPNPPSYWDEVTEMVPALTLMNGSSIVEAGIALGTPDVSYMKDITMAVISQLGQAPVTRVPAANGQFYIDVTANTPVQEGGEVLPLTTVNRFFTQFADPGQKTYSWKEGLGNPVEAFVAEKLAMYIGYSGEYATLRARNPRGEFEMTTLPQTRGYNTFSTGMRMYSIATLKSSKNAFASFTVQSQFAGAGVSPALASQVGAVPALRSYAGTQGLNPVIARSMLVARGWYDKYPNETNTYAQAMISDIINQRYGVADASALFVNRLRDLYTRP
jgi:ABC-type glycerol-3-phosphate transport system substrate-binding protein